MEERISLDELEVIAKTGISGITVGGFKSIIDEQFIEIRPLTILAGANSSGKSSIMQPLLLLKQTLEAPYDPGALKIDGPNVIFTSAEQLLSHEFNNIQNSFHAGINIKPLGIGNDINLTSYYINRKKTKQFEIDKMIYGDDIFRIGMSAKNIRTNLPELFETIFDDEIPKNKLKWIAERDRCFIRLFLVSDDGKPSFGVSLTRAFNTFIRGLIHLPGLRGNPERDYPVSAVGSSFPGTFDNYFASVITTWENNKDRTKLLELCQNLSKLNLTKKVQARLINSTQVEIQVSRLSQNGNDGLDDMVSIADVGLGVSQTLPVLVALLVAEPGQLVYLEQPEIHLHPRAQTVLAEIIADAAKRGVRVVVETHSDLLILGVQTLVAEGKLSPELVKLHWFSRNEKGATSITSADLDETGAFGEDWPEDFADVRLEAQQRYLDAAEARLVEA